MLHFPRTLARRSRWSQRSSQRFIGGSSQRSSLLSRAAAAAAGPPRSKSALLDEIMAWRAAFAKEKGGRQPTQADIVNDPKGAALLREWQAIQNIQGQDIQGQDIQGAGPEGGQRIDPAAADPAIEAKKEEVKAELLAWRAEFERARGRAPTREDMFGDAGAADLFARFQSYTELDWPAEMRLLLNADLTPTPPPPPPPQ